MGNNNNSNGLEGDERQNAMNAMETMRNEGLHYRTETDRRALLSSSARLMPLFDWKTSNTQGDRSKTTHAHTQSRKQALENVVCEWTMRNDGKSDTGWKPDCALDSDEQQVEMNTAKTSWNKASYGTLRKKQASQTFLTTRTKRKEHVTAPA